MTIRRALGNGSIMLLSQLITWTASLVFTAALGRSLGDVGFGNLYVATSLALIFGVLIDFGLDQQLIRAVARNRGLAARYLLNSLTIKTMLATVAYASVLVISYLLNYAPELRMTIGVYCLILFLSGVSNSLTAVYQATENVLHSAVGIVLEKCSVCVLGLMLLALGYGVVAMAAVFVVGSALGVSWKALFLFRRLRPFAPPDRETLRMLVLGALPFFLYWALGSVYYRVDVVLLSKLTDQTVVGWYGAAYRLFDTLVFLPSIVSSAIMFPILSRLAVHSRAELRLAVDKGLGVMLILGVPICTGLIVLADPIIRLIYGRTEFLPAIPALQLLAIGLLVLYINSILAVVLVSLNQERKMTVVAGLATVLNLSLNWLLIPQFQHIAAAAVTAGTELFILCYLLWFVPKDILSFNSLVVLAKAGTSAAVMAAVLIMLQAQNVLLLVLLGAATYAMTGLALRLVPPEDLRLVRMSFGSRHAQETAAAEFASGG